MRINCPRNLSVVICHLKAVATFTDSLWESSLIFAVLTSHAGHVQRYGCAFQCVTIVTVLISIKVISVVQNCT